MQKRIIVIAMSAALSAPAFADTSNVTVYGVINLSADYISTGDEAAVGGAKGVNKFVVSSNQTRLGFKGAEQLSDGMSAIWQIESLVQVDNSTTSVLAGGRNSFAGLKSDNIGTILFGRHDTPYQMTTRKLDVFMDGLADSRGLMGGGAAAPANTASRVAFDGRQPDSIVYLTPTWGGFSGALARVNTTEDRTAAGRASSSITSLGGMYTAGPIYASLAYEMHDFNAAGAGRDTSEDSVKAGFGYTQESFLVNAVFEQSSDDFGALPAASVGGSCFAKALGADCFGHTSIYVGGKFNIGDGAIKAAVAKTGKLGDAVNTEAQQVSIGYDHNLSKRTIAYVQYTQVSNDDAVNYGLAGNSTGGGALTRNGNGADPSAFSFGVRHMF